MQRYVFFLKKRTLTLKITPIYIYYAVVMVEERMLQASASELFVMIRLALDDGAGAIYLFRKDKAHHLVGKRQARQR